MKIASVRRIATAESGSALFIALMALSLLGLVGALIMTQVTVEMQTSGSAARSHQALGNAEAGYAEALIRMSDPKDATNYVGESPTGQATQPGWGRYLVRATGESSLDPLAAQTESDGLNNDGDGSTDETGERYPEVPSRQMTGGVRYPWVKINYRLNGSNQVLRLGDHDLNQATPPQANVTRGMPIIRIASAGKVGRETRTVSIQAARPPFSGPRTSLYVEDDDFTFNGSSFEISGGDWDPNTGTLIGANPEVPGILTTGIPSAIATAAAGHTSQVNGNGAEPSIQTAPQDIDLSALAQAYLDDVDLVIPAGSYTPSWGGLNDYQIVHCTGDLSVSGNGGGGGVLVVDGDFQCTGQFSWYGLIIVLGDIDLSGGGNDVHVWGSLYAQGGGSSQSFSGNAKIHYSSEVIERLAVFHSYRLLDWKEI